MPKQRERVVVDWDDTCVENNWPGHGEWLPGAVEGLKALRKRYEVVIFSCRLAGVETDERRKRTKQQVAAEYSALRQKLNSAGLHRVKLWDRCYKPSAVAYIDDKGIRFEGNWNDTIRAVSAGVGNDPRLSLQSRVEGRGNQTTAPCS